MSELHLVRLRVRSPEFMRFAKDQGLLNSNEDRAGYAMHAWLAAMFGSRAPKPFRFDPFKGELLGYCDNTAAALAEQAQAFASPIAHSVLAPDSLVSKAMPLQWPVGRALRLDVEVCPVSRKDDDEKDVYLRALDRLGDAAPTREVVYCEWLRGQLEPALSIDALEISALSQRERMMRPDRTTGSRRLRLVERPRVRFLIQARIRESDQFAQLLARGVGRHRAFGFGMFLLGPAA